MDRSGSSRSEFVLCLLAILVLREGLAVSGDDVRSGWLLMVLSGPRVWSRYVETSTYSWSVFTPPDVSAASSGFLDEDGASAGGSLGGISRSGGFTWAGTSAIRSLGVVF